MRRLEYTPLVRGRSVHARNAAEAVMHLAVFARERHRLQQERSSLAKRLHRIETRLSEIATTETKLAPLTRLLGAMSEGVPARTQRDAMLQY